jgi:hypothetical protein
MAKKKKKGIGALAPKAKKGIERESYLKHET